MKNRLFIWAAILSVLFAPSCVKDDGILYHNLTEFGVVRSDGSILSDEGVILSITSKECAANPDTMHRVLYMCDVTKKVSEENYEIVLKDIMPVKEMNTVLFSSPEAQARPYDDPVYVSSSWFAGGYLNLAVSFYVKTDSQTPHSFLLVEDVPVHDDSQDKQVDVNLRLYHQGGGESYANPELEMTDLHLVNTYLSIPVDHLDPYHGGTPGDGMFLRLERLWHTYDYDEVDRETKLYYSYGTFNLKEN